MNKDSSETVHSDELKIVDTEPENTKLLHDSTFKKSITEESNTKISGVEKINSIVKEEEDKEENDSRKMNTNNGDGDDDEMESVETNIYITKFDGRTSQIPEFAVIYSFIDLFGFYLDLPQVTISDFEASIDSTKELNAKKADDLGLLEILHVKLFRRLNKSTKFSSLANCQIERLEKIILKFTQLLDLNLAWDLQEFGYHILTSAQKLTILKHLCELQFDENIKFQNTLKEVFKADQGTSLRLEPYGYEQEGLNVWLHEDKDYNFRVYAGEADDELGESWKVRAGSMEDLEVYISQLKIQTEVNPKDVAAEKIKERKETLKLVREKRKKEKEAKRSEEEEKKVTKNIGRKSRRSKTKETESSNESEESDEDDGCARCYENKQSDLVLLCDGCDAAYHTLCLRPPVIDIPDGDWFCPFCHQLKLIEKLQIKYNDLHRKILAKERKSKRLNFYGIRAANILSEPEENTGYGRRCTIKKVDYNFSAYDEMIDDAVKVNTKSSKTNLNGQQTNAQEASRRPKRSNTGHHNRKLNNLDSDDNSSSGSEYVLSESDSEFRRRNNINDFLVDDDYDELEEQHRNKYLRRSKRNREHHRSDMRRRYRDDGNSNDDNVLDTSSDSGPRRSKRQRRGDRKYYQEHFSDENESGNEKSDADRSDEFSEWKNEFREEVLSDGDDEKDYESDVITTPSRKRKQANVNQRKRRKKKKVIESEDDDDEDEEEDILFQDESDEEKDGNKAEVEDTDEEAQGSNDLSMEEESLVSVQKEVVSPKTAKRGNKVSKETVAINKCESLSSSHDLKMAIVTKDASEVVNYGPNTRDVLIPVEKTVISQTSICGPLPCHVKSLNSTIAQERNIPSIDLKTTAFTPDQQSLFYRTSASVMPPPHQTYRHSENAVVANQMSDYVTENIQKALPPNTLYNPLNVSSSSVSIFRHGERSGITPTSVETAQLPSWERSMSNKAQPLSPAFQQYSLVQRFPPFDSYHSPYQTSQQHYADVLYQDRLMEPMRPTPMRPTPMYSHQSSHLTQHSSYPSHWANMMGKHSTHYYDQQLPQSMSATKLYSSASPATHQQYSHPGWEAYAQHEPGRESNLQLNKDVSKSSHNATKKQLKKNLKEEKQMKKIQKMFEKEQRKLGRASPATDYRREHEPNVAKGIGFFKSMVISGNSDENNSNTITTSYNSSIRM